MASVPGTAAQDSRTPAPGVPHPPAVSGDGSGAPRAQADAVRDALTLIDRRTGRSIDIPIVDGQAVLGPDIARFANPVVPGVLRSPVLRVLDPGLRNVACCRSAVSWIDGAEGKLYYRGYSIDDLVEHSTFLEVAFLLLTGELPCAAEARDFTGRVMHHTYLHETLLRLLGTFHYDAHPMGMLVSALAALSTFYPGANPSLQGEQLFERRPDIVFKQVYRVLGKLPTIAAFCYRHRIGRAFTEPDSTLGYTQNFLYMLDVLHDQEYRPHPVFVQALDVLFILHAEHGTNCSTAVVRHVGSTLVDPFTMLAASASALYGPRHGGATQRVLEILEDIGEVSRIPAFLEQVKRRERLLFGFGHRVYKSYDPRARLIRHHAHKVFALVGEDPLLQVATALEAHALKDPFFVSRQLFPNVDFYSGLVYRAMGFPSDMFPVLFAVPRVVGWLSHWLELLREPGGGPIFRPRQVYVGSGPRKYVPMSERPVRPQDAPDRLACTRTIFSRRREISMQEQARQQAALAAEGAGRSAGAGPAEHTAAPLSPQTGV